MRFIRSSNKANSLRSTRLNPPDLEKVNHKRTERVFSGIRPPPHQSVGVKEILLVYPPVALHQATARFIVSTCVSYVAGVNTPPAVNWAGINVL